MRKYIYTKIYKDIYKYETQFILIYIMFSKINVNVVDVTKYENYILFILISSLKMKYLSVFTVLQSYIQTSNKGTIMQVIQCESAQDL